MTYYTFNSEWRDIQLETGECYSYGDFKEFKGVVTEEDKKWLFIIPEHFEGSDYAGSSVSVSNHRSFLKEFDKVKGVYDLYGGYNTYAIAIRADVAETHEGIKETLDALENYGIMNESDLSEVEDEWHQEAMKDVVSDLCRHIDLEEFIPEYEKLLEDTETIEELAWEAILELDLSWSEENCYSYIDSDEIKPYVEDRLLLDHCKELPLFVNREWSCKQTSTMYEQKLKGI